nr:hypothetical protein [Chloroflexota bacterium]
MLRTGKEHWLGWLIHSKQGRLASVGVLLACLCLVGCRGTQPVATPTIERVPTEMLAPAPTFTPTLFSSEGCIWDWGTRPLPELSAQVQAALASAGITDATVSAVAYGEDCIDPQTGNVKGFALLETDFYFTLPVSSLAVEPLGNLAEQLLTVLDSLPVGSIPGTQPGYVGMDFVAGEECYHLWFEVTLWWEARQAGLHGAALLQALSRPFAQTPVPTATPVPTVTAAPRATLTPELS